jgi:peroxiredoxin
MPSDGIPVGETAPAFEAPLVRPDGPTETVPVDDLLADAPVLLSFYTADFSPDCIEEWCAFRDFDWFGTGDEVRVVGVSKSGTGLHRKFIDRLGLGFPLYSDSDLAVAEAYDVAYRAFHVSRRSKRSCFLLDRDRTVLYKWVGDHWLDPSRDVPPVPEIYEAVTEALDVEKPETFGF